MTNVNATIKPTEAVVDEPVVIDEPAAEGAVEKVTQGATANTEAPGKEEKPKIELTRVSGPPPVPLKVNMARQASEFFTGPQWPDVHQLTKPFNYVLQPDGLWEIRNVQAGWLVRRREKFGKKLPGFIEEERSDYGIPRYGKVPSELYWQIVSFFKEICSDSGDEVYVQTFWNPEENVYFNHVPKQIVSGASVRYERNQELEDRCPLVVETHSHNNMSAFFSGVDNADEKSDRFFGVLGKLGTHNPEVLYSFLCGGVRTNVPVSDIFDLGHPNTFPSGWKDQVTHQSAIATHSTTNSWSGYGVDRPGYQGQTRHFGPGRRPPGSQGNLWKGNQTKAQEAKREIEEGASRAEAEISSEWTADDFLAEINGEDCGEGSLTHAPFFQLSSRKSSIADKLLTESITDLILEFSDTERSLAMSEEEKEQLFLNLIEVLGDDDVHVLAGALADQGYGEHMLQALDSTDEFEDDPVEVDEDEESE